MRKPEDYAVEYQGRVSPRLCEVIAKVQSDAYSAGFNAGRTAGMSELMNVADATRARLEGFFPADPVSELVTR